MARRLWLGFSYIWAAAIVGGVVWLVRSDDTIQPTITDFVVILCIALAPAWLGPAATALIRHLRRPAD